ncbi:hypothetical protein SLNWT_6777 [Streptomyces albus]|uniref:Uncharacterized protein n=1 Tax=Streptomyces albus (strain ATCC 21838 / DSM 41398 / FERM P-419 / JCM 4703 / NBRC 107858) TaxID=1081613 RepID=A0A0B5EWF0_STRA4|nr:hypothetical protein SLNWT_6777 [Streptomyces albus]AOU81458.1 hypothetical protein SLNHY_6767 [Streptomyces albus]AYN37151.1 hypothetical protein DUI70_6658 [Streptomyces albus]
MAQRARLVWCHRSAGAYRGPSGGAAERRPADGAGSGPAAPFSMPGAPGS